MDRIHIYKFAYQIFLLCILSMVTSCDINDSYVDCETESTIVVYFRYYGDTTDETNVINHFFNDAVLYVYDQSSNNLTHVFKVTKDELLYGKQLTLEKGKYHFVCWGNQAGRSKVSNEQILGAATISAPELGNMDKILSNDDLYFASLDLEIEETPIHNEELENQNKQTAHTLTFKCSHINFLVRVYGIKQNKNIRLEITNLMPQYNFAMEETKPFETSYFPVVTNTVTDNEGMVFFREFDFAVLRFKNINNKEIQIKLFDEDNLEIIAPEASLQDLLSKYNVDVEKHQDITIYIEYKFSELGVTVSIKEWKEEPVIPGS